MDRQPASASSPQTQNSSADSDSDGNDDNDVATQPIAAGTQEYLLTSGITQPLFTQAQSVAPYTLSMCTQMTTENAFATQPPSQPLLATQPITQLEINRRTMAEAAEEQFSNAEAGGDDADQPISQPTTQPISQPMTQPISEVRDAKTENAHDIMKRCEQNTGAENDNDNTALNGDKIANEINDIIHNRGMGGGGDAVTGSNCNSDWSQDDNDTEQCANGQKTGGLLMTMHDRPANTRDDEISDQLQAETQQPIFSPTIEEAVAGSSDGVELSSQQHLQNKMGTNGGDATSNRNDAAILAQTPVPNKRKVVANPYAKNKTPAAAKRSVDQISRISSSNSVATSSDVANHSSDVRFDNPNNNAPRKQVFNPYAKPKQTPAGTSRRQPAIRNPYAKVKAAATMPSSTAIPAAKNDTVNHRSPVVNDNVVDMAVDKQWDNVSVAARPSSVSTNKPTQVRRSGISISLPMADRLPSRNVSYQPAEILTVGELYRYLYLYNEAEEAPAGMWVVDPIANVLTSVRITGTLLSVTTSHRCEKDGSRGGNPHDDGTFLLVGDPLNNTRLLTKELATKRSDNDCNTILSVTATPSFDNASKAPLTSILRNKNTPAPPSTALEAAKTPGLKSAVTKPNASIDMPSSPAQAEAPDVNSQAERTATASAAGTSKPLSGILATNKKKRLVYNKAGGKRLSFGGGGKRLSFGGAKASAKGGSLLGRKFVTPKRLNVAGPRSSSLTSSTYDAGMQSTLKRNTFRSANTGTGENTRPEHIIQRHPSPIVPIWIGSHYNGDGLDGSVVGDLVMIMGEVVVRHCANCQMEIAPGDDEHVHVVSRTDRVDDGPSGAAMTQQPQHQSLATPAQIQRVSDAAISIASVALKTSGSTNPTRSIKCNKTFCGQCSRYIQARFVKKANGTDMCLQKEALKARRKYILERKRQMECLTSQNLYSVGCGASDIS